MITYILECSTIQLVFLLVYDLFLKKETFFQWNRIYLLGTFMLSLFLPWIKIEAFKTTVPENLVQYQQFFWQLDGVVLSANNTDHGFWEGINWGYVFIGAGILVMTVWLIVKLNRIYKLKRNGIVSLERDFVKVVIPKSEQAFSFFKNVFLGGSIPQEKQENILTHEMVHVKQWHSLDLIFFEVMRIVFWFNPLVYVYQNRISELHEFIADAQASKTDKKKQYELLLSEVFQSQDFSLVNQFFKQSLIKKRIVMLTKEKSKSIYQFKYALLLPLVFGVLIYTSCEKGKETLNATEDSGIVEIVEREIPLAEKLSLLNKEIEALEEFSEEERNEIAKMAQTMVLKTNQSARTVDGWKVTTGINADNKSSSGNREEVTEAMEKNHYSIPFALIEEAPIFPGCENAEDKKACFMEKLTEHIRKNFKYPEEAQEQGIQGRVNVIFRINGEGDIGDIRKRGPHELLEDEAVRIIARLPKMTPGKQEGKPVTVPFSIPITFKLD